MAAEKKIRIIAPGKAMKVLRPIRALNGYRENVDTAIQVIGFQVNDTSILDKLAMTNSAHHVHELANHLQHDFSAAAQMVLAVRLIGAAYKFARSVCYNRPMCTDDQRRAMLASAALLYVASSCCFASK